MSSEKSLNFKLFELPSCEPRVVLWYGEDAEHDEEDVEAARPSVTRARLGSVG